MDTYRTIRQLTALASVVEQRNLDGFAYMDLLARYSLHPAAGIREELPRFAYALSKLIAANPGVVFPAAKIARTLRDRIERLQAADDRVGLKVPPVGAGADTGTPAPVPTPAVPDKPKRPKRAKPKPTPVLAAPPAVLYDESPEGEIRELEGLRDRIVAVGTPAFVDYLGDPAKIPCVPIQLLGLREPDCLEWSAERLVAAIDELIRPGECAKRGPTAWRLSDLEC